MKPGMRVWKAFAVAMVFVSASSGRSRAQDYPSRSITVIVPFPAGGASDVVARIVTDQMAKILGQSIIIENVGGAGGTVGSARVAAAAPDGYTLLAAAWARTSRRPVLTPNLKYDPVADFVPIGITAHSPAVIIARKDFPAKDLKEFVAVLRQKGDAREAGPWRHRCVLAHGVPAVQRGGRHQADAGRLSRFRPGAERPGRRPRRLPVRAVGQRGGVGSRRHGQSLRGLGRERLATLPDVPTAKEAGVNYEMSVWAGLFAPKGTPPEVIAKLADALDKALDEMSCASGWPSSAERYRPRTSAARLHSTVLCTPRSPAGHPFLLRPERRNEGECAA